MTTIARFELKMDSAEKDLLAQAAALMGTTMASFVRMAAKDKAQELLARESQVLLGEADFQAFTAALNQPFAPNAALQQAMQSAASVSRK